MPKKQLFFLCLLLVGFCGNLGAQSHVPVHFDTIRYDEDLSNLLFSRADTLRDSSFLKGGMEDFYNVPVRSNVFASGDCDTASLFFCKCLSHHDTLFVVLTGPSICCYNELTVKIAGDQFNSSFLFSMDFSPADVHLNSVNQKLILKDTVTAKGEMLEGYICFEGKGKFGESNFDEDFSKEVKKAVFSALVQGFFKCPIESR